MHFDIAAGKAPLTLDFLPRFGRLLHHIAPLLILFYTGLWLIKASMLVFFYKVGSIVKAHRIWIWVVTGVTAAAYAAGIATIPYDCSLTSTEHILRKLLTFRWRHVL